MVPVRRVADRRAIAMPPALRGKTIRLVLCGMPPPGRRCHRLPGSWPDATARTNATGRRGGSRSVRRSLGATQIPPDASARSRRHVLGRGIAAAAPEADPLRAGRLARDVAGNEHGDGAVIECGLPVVNPSVGPGGIETGPGRLEFRQGDDGPRLFAYRSRAAISVAVCTILPCVGRVRPGRSSTPHQDGGDEGQGLADWRASVTWQQVDVTAPKQPRVRRHQCQAVHLGSGGDEAICRILVVEVHGTAGDRHIDGKRDLGDRGDRHRLAKPTMGIGVENDPAALGKEQSFPHADRGEKELGLAGLQGMSCGIAEPVRVKKAPQPDVRIEQQRHLPEDIPFREFRRRCDEIVADLAIVLHRAEPFPGR